MREIMYRDAIREAMAEEMRRDPSVFLMGEDVAEHGGNFLVTTGLYEEFGEERVFDTPLSESALVGAGVGAAMMGMRPIVEVMFADFVTIAMDAIANHAAKVYYMSGGEVTAPMVIRLAAYGAGRRSGAHHSQSVESLLDQCARADHRGALHGLRCQGAAEGSHSHTQPGDLPRAQDAVCQEGRGA